MPADTEETYETEETEDSTGKEGRSSVSYVSPPTADILAPPPPPGADTGNIPSSPEDFQEVIRRYIDDTCKLKPWDKGLFRFVRLLRGSPLLSDVPRDEFRPWVRKWRQQAGIEPTMDEVWAEFCNGWEKMKYPVNDADDIVAFALRLAKEAPLPPEAALYKDPDFKLMVAVLRQLSELRSPEPIFLSRRKAHVLGIDKMKAQRIFPQLERDGILVEVKKSTGYSSPHWRYVQQQGGAAQ